MALPKIEPASLIDGPIWATSYTQHPGYGPPVQYQHIKVAKPSAVTWSWDADPSLPAMEYKVVKVPVGTPYVDRGSHSMRVPGVGCTMEMVSALAGEVWTDHPRTAHPELTRLMINTNDLLPDDERQKMVELVPRLLDTNMVLEQDLEDLIIRSDTQAYAITGQARAMGRGVDPASASFLLRNAQHLLDEFDKRLNRPTRKMDDQTLTRLMMALAA